MLREAHVQSKNTEGAFCDLIYSSSLWCTKSRHEMQSLRPKLSKHSCCLHGQEGPFTPAGDGTFAASPSQTQKWYVNLTLHSASCFCSKLVELQNCSISAFHHCMDFYRPWASSMSRGSISGTQCWMRDWHTASHKRTSQGETENKLSPGKMNQAAICVAFFLQSIAGLHECSGTDTQNLPYQNRIKSDSCKI